MRPMRIRAGRFHGLSLVDDPTHTKSSQRKRPHVVAEMLHTIVQEQASKVSPWEQLAGIAHNNPCGYAGQLAVVCEQTDGQATVPNALSNPSANDRGSRSGASPVECQNAYATRGVSMGQASNAAGLFLARTMAQRRLVL